MVVADIPGVSDPGRVGARPGPHAAANHFIFPSRSSASAANGGRPAPPAVPAWPSGTKWLHAPIYHANAICAEFHTESGNQMPSTLARRLQLKHLRLLVAIAELGQLSLAAQALGMTQPAASRSLSEVEGFLGGPAFERHPKGMTLTPVGEAIVRRARNMLDELGEAAREVDRLSQGSGGMVRIGAVTGAAVGYVVPAVRELKASAPDLDLHVQVGNSEELMADLLATRFDMILGRLPAEVPPTELELVPASGERVDILASAGGAFGGGPVSLADLVDAQWVIQGPGAPIRRAVERALLELGAPPPANVINTSSLLVTLALLREPGVIAPVSGEAADLLVSGNSELIRLDLKEEVTVSAYSLITLRGRRLSPAALRCHSLMTDIVLRRRGDPAEPERR